ncbi:hypothetical protein TCAL_00892 [Tigriopus californicus]|uniref:C2H2-type domain-containing protein n=1 Tax=Tigriopus californicus TaxID=6832 RepID=A0A553P6H7_TIGCA|nr:hypothetical protein TCAL_00892 [Tigriopus californicus]|eukprot:TCALIF_00892-PA protein Name:"Similar to jing Zinc finger protein jing (Drosophila melanogaster)" AED:0.18 eAED:0.16 QI:0/0.33/0.25/0.75/0.66/0.5/4/1119/609
MVLTRSHRRGASLSSPMSSSFLPPSIKMSSLAGGSSTRCYQRKNSLNVVGPGTTALALPSPTGSSSETSDYQRSTPSPRDEHDSGIGKHPFDLRRGGTLESYDLLVPISGSIEEWSSESQASRDDADLGFSEDLKEPLVPAVASIKTECSSISNFQKRPQAVKRRCTFDEADPLDPRLMLQQVRVALEKIPNLEALDHDVPSGMSQDDCVKLLKRRHSECSSQSSSSSAVIAKKIKLEEDNSSSKGKITSYLSETKHFTALRKEKLDRILNLKTEISSQLPLSTIAPPQSLPTKLDPEHHQNKNDLYLISQLKQLKDAKKADQFSHAVIHSELKDQPIFNSQVSRDDLKSSDKLLSHLSHPLESEGRKTNRNDQTCFEVPSSVIRFPLTRPSLDTTLCKWKACEEALESTGKLIDHLKNVHADSQNIEGEDEFQYKCLWVGCKVHGKGSSSRTWLEKHILSHGGNKPFQCIVDGCKKRFSTQSLLERHVNGHFKSTTANASQSQPGTSSGFHGSARKSMDSTSGSSTPLNSIVKSMRKAGRKLNLPDEWTNLKSLQPYKTVKLSALPQSAKAFVSSQVHLKGESNCAPDDSHLNRRKRRFPQQSSSSLS